LKESGWKLDLGALTEVLQEIPPDTKLVDEDDLRDFNWAWNLDDEDLGAVRSGDDSFSGGNDFRLV
jgi:hypothetical protein